MTAGRLEADGCTLTPISTDHVDDLHAIWTDEPVRRFLWDGEILPIETTREIVEANAGLFEAHGYGIWGARDSSSNRLLGFAGFWHFREPPALELLFGIATEHWGRGLATGSARRVIAYAFDELAFDVVDASADVENVASIRVLEKLGMTRTRRAVVDGLDTVFYQIRRDA